MAVTALDWLYPRAPSVHAVIMYLVEPDKDKVHTLLQSSACSSRGLDGCSNEDVPFLATCEFPVVVS